METEFPVGFSSKIQKHFISLIVSSALISIAVSSLDDKAWTVSSFVRVYPERNEIENTLMVQTFAGSRNRNLKENLKCMFQAQNRPFLFVCNDLIMYFLCETSTKKVQF